MLLLQSKGVKGEEGSAQQEPRQEPLSAAGSTESLPGNHSSLGHIRGNTSGCDAPMSALQGARSPCFAAWQPLQLCYKLLPCRTRVKVF